MAAAHGVGGLVGALLTGVLARGAWGGSDGLLSGNPSQLWIQALGVLGVMLYSGLVSFGLLKLVGLFSALRSDGRHEGLGLDVIEHGEQAYTSGEGAILVIPDAARAPKLTASVGAGSVERRVGGEV